MGCKWMVILSPLTTIHTNYEMREFHYSAFVQNICTNHHMWHDLCSVVLLLLINVFIFLMNGIFNSDDPKFIGSNNVDLVVNFSFQREKDKQMGESKVLMKAVLIVMTKRKHNHLAVLLLVLRTLMYATYIFEAH